MLDLVRGCLQGQGNLAEGTPSSRLWCEPNRPTSAKRQDATLAAKLAFSVTTIFLY